MSMALPIPQTDPKAGYLAHKEEIDAAILHVLEKGWYILGREVEAFEEEFGAYLGLGHAVGVGNGTDALELALRAAGIGAGSTVFTVSHTAVATVAAVERAGARPVLVDIDPETFTMDPDRLEDALRKFQATSGSRSAVIPVHLYGHPADMPAILEISRRYELLVVEDCAQSHGASIDGKPTGAWGDIAAFSFYPTKNLGALGDGGIIVTADAELAQKARLERQYGWAERYISATPGGNSRLDELQAAILRVKLRYLDQENKARRNTAQYYNQQIGTEAVIKPEERPGCRHVYHQYVVRVPERTAFQKYLLEKGIHTGIHYPQPVHLQPAYHGRLEDAGGLPVTEQIAAEILSLPMYPQLDESQAQYVVERVNAWGRGRE